MESGEGLKRPDPADFGSVSQKNPNTDTNIVMPLMKEKLHKTT